MKNRREFIIDSSLAATALAIGPLNSASSAAGPGAECRSLDNLSYAALAGQIKSVFRVRVSASRMIDIKLVNAPLSAATTLERGAPLPSDALNERFSLIFSGPGDWVIDPAIHRFEHSVLGKFDMYIGQFGRRSGTTICYEAVFNRPAGAC